MKERILDIITVRGDMSVVQLMKELGVSRQYIHRVLAMLIDEGRIERIGIPPKTYYRRLSIVAYTYDPQEIAEGDQLFLASHFLVITETGNRLEGLAAMNWWCQRQRLPLAKTVQEFIQTKQKYLAYREAHSLINGMDKLRNTKGLETIGLDELYYQDFYAIERFGKTRLGTLLHFAKQSQDRQLIQEIVAQIRPTVLQLIEDHHIEAVGFIPPTIRREVQFMHVLEEKLSLALPILQIAKIRGRIVVPQKALSKIEERVVNARTSFLLEDDSKYKRVLLIDDAVGSGATINEMAVKIKRKQVAPHVVGYVITGSYKGFEVIQEV